MPHHLSPESAAGISSSSSLSLAIKKPDPALEKMPPEIFGRIVYFLIKDTLHLKEKTPSYLKETNPINLGNIIQALNRLALASKELRARVLELREQPPIGLEREIRKAFSVSSAAIAFIPLSFYFPTNTREQLAKSLRFSPFREDVLAHMPGEAFFSEKLIYFQSKIKPEKEVQPLDANALLTLPWWILQRKPDYLPTFYELTQEPEFSCNVDFLRCIIQEWRHFALQDKINPDTKVAYIMICLKEAMKPEPPSGSAFPKKVVTLLSKPLPEKDMSISEIELYVSQKLLEERRLSEEAKNGSLAFPLIITPTVTPAPSPVDSPSSSRFRLWDRKDSSGANTAPSLGSPTLSIWDKLTAPVRRRNSVPVLS